MIEAKNCPECGRLLYSNAPGVYVCEDCCTIFRSGEWETQSISGEPRYIYYANIEKVNGTMLGLRIDLGLGVHIRGDMFLAEIALDADVESRILELACGTVVVETIRRSIGKGLVWMVKVRLSDGRDLGDVLVKEGAARALIS